jgi:hypothetical protein
LDYWNLIPKFNRQKKRKCKINKNGGTHLGEIEQRKYKAPGTEEETVGASETDSAAPFLVFNQSLITF